MFRKGCNIVLAAAVVGFAALPCFGWKFASIADSRTGTNGVNVTELTKIVNAINAENVDLVLFAGDACDGSSTDSTLSSQMDTWLSVMVNLNCPYYYVPGNHEVRSYTSEDVLRTKFDQPLNGPPGHEEMVYSFDHQNAHFVGLNSNHEGEDHHVQRSWLTTDLASTDQPQKFVFAHEPAYPAGPHIGSSLDAYPGERDDFWSIMSGAGVGMYFTGHEHLYQRTTHGSIYHVINGTCGAPISTGVPNTIGAYHYVVVDIDGYNVNCQAKYDDGTPFDSWSYIVPQEVTCAQAKHLPDGTKVLFKDKVVTYVRGSMFYIEEEDRSGAFRSVSSTPPVPGDKVTVNGTIQTYAALGERQVVGTVTVGSHGNPVPEPLGMTNRDVLGGELGYTPGAYGAVGLNNSGMLIRIFGRVTNTTTSAFYLDDGSGIADGTSWTTPNVGVRVLWSGDVSVGQYVMVTGICGAFTDSGNICRMIYAKSVN